jgi:hypothetical protein
MYLEKGEFDDYVPTNREKRQINQERKGKSVQRGGNKRIHMLAELDRERYFAGKTPANADEEQMRNSITHGDHKTTAVTAADNPYDVWSDNEGRIHSDSVLYDRKGNNLETSRAKSFSVQKSRGSRRPLMQPETGPNAATGGGRLVQGDENYEGVKDFKPGELVRSEAAPGGAMLARPHSAKCFCSRT